MSNVQYVQFNEWVFDADFATARGSDVAPIRFTRQEQAVLARLVRYPGRLVSREQLLDSVDPNCGGTGERSVDFIVNRLRRKLHDDARKPRFIATRYGEGYAWLVRGRPVEPPSTVCLTTRSPRLGLERRDRRTACRLASAALCARAPFGWLIHAPRALLRIHSGSWAAERLPVSCLEGSLQRSAAQDARKKSKWRRILREILLVIVAAEEESATQITRLHDRYCQDRRLPVDVAAVPAVDLAVLPARGKVTRMGILASREGARAFQNRAVVWLRRYEAVRRT